MLNCSCDSDLEGPCFYALTPKRQQKEHCLTLAEQCRIALVWSELCRTKKNLMVTSSLPASAGCSKVNKMDSTQIFVQVLSGQLVAVECKGYHSVQDLQLRVQHDSNLFPNSSRHPPLKLKLHRGLHQRASMGMCFDFKEEEDVSSPCEFQELAPEQSLQELKLVDGEVLHAFFDFSVQQSNRLQFA